MPLFVISLSFSFNVSLLSFLFFLDCPYTHARSLILQLFFLSNLPPSPSRRPATGTDLCSLWCPTTPASTALWASCMSATTTSRLPSRTSPRCVSEGVGFFSFTVTFFFLFFSFYLSPPLFLFPFLASFFSSNYFSLDPCPTFLSPSSTTCPHFSRTG